jgi:hypothetical protein
MSEWESENIEGDNTKINNSNKISKDKHSILNNKKSQHR